MKQIKKLDKESRKDYLYRVMYAYLKEIEYSVCSETLSIQLKYDGAECDGACLIEDVENEIELEGVVPKKLINKKLQWKKSKSAI